MMKTLDTVWHIVNGQLRLRPMEYWRLCKLRTVILSTDLNPKSAEQRELFQSDFQRNTNIGGLKLKCLCSSRKKNKTERLIAYDYTGCIEISVLYFRKEISVRSSN